MEPNQNNVYPGADYQEQYVPAESLARYTAKTFLWMFVGLLFTFAVAIGLIESRLILVVYSIPYFYIILPVVGVAMVWIFVGRIHKMSVAGARVVFFVYAAVISVVLTTYLLAYDVFSVMLVFGATSLYFGGMAIFGYVTKLDLTKLRFILTGGVIFLIAFWLLSAFIPGLQVFDRAICLIGIAIFLGFTAYDTQKIKTFYNAYAGDDAMLKKASIFSALQLYLDFINIFLYLLRFLGKRK